MTEAGSATVVRAPNHLGDVVMALPALRASHADVVVASALAPLLGMSDLPGGVLALPSGTRGFMQVARKLRSRRYESGTLLAPSFSSALLFRAGGVRRIRGAGTDRRALLLDDALPHTISAGIHRSVLYWQLVTGEVVTEPPVPTLDVPEAARATLRTLCPDDNRLRAGLFPGSNAPSRRWDTARFAELAAKLNGAGWQVLVFGGPADARLTAQVAGVAAVDLGGRTDLCTLAAGLASCAVVVSNDSGPMHLAAAVGAPVLGLFGAGDPVATRPLGEHCQVLRHPELPCVPCVKNSCPRRGPGYILPDAERECLRLIEVKDVLMAVQRMAAR